MPLRPKSLALLRLLVENAGRVVDRDAIMAAVWPDVVVGDELITQCVRDIRKALGDDAQQVLKTVPKRGYLFAAEVTPAETTAPPARRAPPGGDPGRRRRRLFATDRQDEAGTLAASRRLREQAIDPLLAEHKGRIVKLMGDGSIVEFARWSMLSLARSRCRRRGGPPAKRRPTGASVPHRRQPRRRGGRGRRYLRRRCQVAARLGHCASRAGSGSPARSTTRCGASYRTGSMRSASVGSRTSSSWFEVYAVQAATEDRGSGSGSPDPMPALSDRLSIAVLPFVNLSGDSRQEYFADGITEDIITDLSRFRDLDVIARNSSFAHKGKAIDVRQVGQSLGVRYVLEGSLQRQGDRVRVSAQLADVATGVHVWSERWERSAADVFAVQTDIAERTANLLAGHGVILHAAAASAKRRRPEDLTAYERYLLGKEHNARSTPHDAEQALKDYRAALEREPTLARVWVGLASSLSQLAGFSVEPEGWDRQSIEAARRAVELDPMDADAHAILGEGLGYAGETAEAEASWERAVALNPSSADILARYAGWAPRFGKPDRGAEAADRARLLNPNWPVSYNQYLCRAYFFVGRHADALTMIERKPATSLHLQDMVYAAASAAVLGHLEQSRLWRDRVLARCPELTAEWHVRAAGTGIGYEKQRRQLAELMVKARFPLCATTEQAARLRPSERLPECEAERAMAAARL